MGSKTSVFLLLVILALAIFFRVWQLDAIPPGLYPDVAINGNDAISALKTGQFKVFYPENNGREGLFMNLIAISFLIFGKSIWSIKVVAAAFGILTVLGLYLATKEIFLNTNLREKAIIIALLASFFLAVSFWHTLFSRIGFRAIMVPFVLVFGIYFLLRGFRTNKISDFILSGIFWGLGFHTYISFRMAVIILGVILVIKLIEYLKKEKIEVSWSWIWKKMYIRNGWWKVDVFLLMIVLVALPIVFYFIQNPQDFMGRAMGVSIFGQDNPLKSGFVSLGTHLAMFTFYGDGNWRHNFANSPMLFWLVGILFLIGFIYSFAYLIKSFKAKDCSLFTVHCLLLVWFFAMLLPGILTSEGIPHALRVIGVMPVVYIFAAIGGWWSYERLTSIIKNKKLLFAVCFLVLALIGYSGFNKYFFIWAKNPNVEGAFTKNFSEIGYYLNSLPSGTLRYVIVNEPGVPVPWPDGIPMPAQTIMFIENTKFGKLQSTYLLPEDLDKIKISGKATIVPLKYEEKIFDELERRFPQGKTQEKDGIFVYEIND